MLLSGNATSENAVIVNGRRKNMSQYSSSKNQSTNNKSNPKP